MFEWIAQLISTLYDVRSIIVWGGIVLICLIIFIETGFFFGFFLPGDSLLVTAGILSATGYFSVGYLLFFASLCAILGDQLNFFIGKKTGELLYKRPDSLLFKKKHLDKAHAFYEKYGAKTIVLARFVPVVRTFAPAVAGAASMNYKTFVTYNVIGGLLWVFSTVLLGYFVGSIIPNVDKYLHLIILIVILTSFIPIGLEFYKEKMKRKIQS